MDRKHFQLLTADVEKMNITSRIYFFGHDKFRLMLRDLRVEASFAHRSKNLSIAYSEVRYGIIIHVEKSKKNDNHILHGIRFK